MTLNFICHKKIDMSVIYEFFIGMSWKIFQVSHVSHMSQKKRLEKNCLKYANNEIFHIINLNRNMEGKTGLFSSVLV